MEAKLTLAIVDYNFLLKEFEHCQQYQLVIPYPHIKSLERLLDTGKKNVSYYKTQQILDYLKEHAIILKINNLPELNVNSKGIKPKTCRFVRYVLAAQKKYPNIKVISNSRESKFLLKQLNIQVSQK
jgi:hypothetical protein